MERFEMWIGIPLTNLDDVKTQKSDNGDLVITVKSGIPAYESCCGVSKENTVGGILTQCRKVMKVALEESLDKFWLENQTGEAK